MNRELSLIEKELQPIESWVSNGIAAFEVEMVPFFGDPSVGNFLTCVSWKVSECSRVDQNPSIFLPFLEMDALWSMWHWCCWHGEMVRLVRILALQAWGLSLKPWHWNKKLGRAAHVSNPSIKGVETSRSGALWPARLDKKLWAQAVRQSYWRRHLGVLALGCICSCTYVPFTHTIHMHIHMTYTCTYTHFNRYNT